MLLCQMALTTAMMIMKFHFQHWIATTLCRRTATFSGISNGKNCFTMLLPYEVQLPKGIRAYELHLKDNYNHPFREKRNTRNITCSVLFLMKACLRATSPTCCA